MQTAKIQNALLVGGGAVAIEFHLPRMLAILGADAVEVVEPEINRRSELAHRFRRDSRVSISAKTDLACDIDLAVIASPPKFHADYFYALAANSRGIVIEQPVAIDVAKAQGILAAQKNRAATVWVNLVRRGLTSFKLLREFWLQDHFGRLESVEFHEGRVYDWDATSLGTFSKEQSGGGVLMDTGPHVLDQLLQVFDVLELEQAFLDGLSTGVEANATLVMRADGVPVTVQLSRNRNLSNTAVFNFENARCRIGVGDDHIAVIPREGSTYSIQAGDPSLCTPTFADLFDRFYVEKLRANDVSGVGIEESLAALQVIEAAYASAQPIREGF